MCLKRSRRLFALCGCAVGALVYSGSGISGEGAQMTSNELVQSAPDAAVAGSNDFAIDLFRSVSRTESGNLFTSPWSLRVALAMTYAGASQETAIEMDETLRFPEVDDREIHQGMSRSIQDLTVADAKYRLSIANRLWAQRDFDLLPGFERITAEYYFAPVSRVDFRLPAEARAEINTWTGEQTDGAVKDLIPEGILSDRTRLVLSNAIHFKGDWESAFPEESTSDAPFYLSSTETTMVPLMHRQSRFEYARDEDVQVLKLPYVGGNLSMIVFLPHARDGLRAFEEGFDVSCYRKLTARLSPALVDAYLPRFRLESTLRLDKALKSMGMILAFDPDRADFSRITGRRDLYLFAALQKAVVEVNEQGTEAAAGSAAVLNTRAMIMPTQFRADHPFLFAITENATGTILFIGRLSNPAMANAP
jgi:serpin B